MAEEIIFKVRVDTGNYAEDLKKIDDELKKVNEDAEKLGNKSTNNLTIPFKLAFNSLLNKKIITHY
jgi:hypothetical protein